MVVWFYWLTVKGIRLILVSISKKKVLFTFKVLPCFNSHNFSTHIRVFSLCYKKTTSAHRWSSSPDAQCGARAAGCAYYAKTLYIIDITSKRNFEEKHETLKNNIFGPTIAKKEDQGKRHVQAVKTLQLPGCVFPC
jgi:hypothetical protein